MKELSIEEKAKAYDGIREKIAIRFGSNVADEIFSEYEESEDEKIRKELVAMVKLSCTNGEDADKKIAWLEKQGEKGAKGNEREIPNSEPPLTIKHAREVMGIKQDIAWSEEDENAIQVLKDIVKHSNEINENIYTTPLKEKLYDWLKSLKERCTWKPSDEQMEALDDFIYAKYPNVEKHEAAVKSLYQDLKKLKGKL